MAKGDDKLIHQIITLLEPRLGKMVTEYRFHPVRRWRFDFAFPSSMVAIEVEGGIWSGGRHVRGLGYEKDMDKYNEAALHGWLVLRFTPEQVRSGKPIAMIEAGWDRG